MTQQIEVQELPAGNGTKLPFVVLVDGEMLRTKAGVGRRFKTRKAAQDAAEFAA